jgi:hypothetical protein
MPRNDDDVSPQIAYAISECRHQHSSDKVSSLHQIQIELHSFFEARAVPLLRTAFSSGKRVFLLSTDMANGKA